MSHQTPSEHEIFQHFVDSLIKTGQVWGLQGPDGGWAVCESTEFEDTTVYVFWTERSEAQKHCVETWAEHVPAPIDLEPFQHEWLEGMHREGYLVGPNWDAELCGIEFEPIDIARGIAGKQKA